MELIKNNIHMNTIEKNMVTTFYVNHEGMVNEAYPEVKKIICQKEKVIADNVSLRNNQLSIDGTLSYEFMYYSNDSDQAYGIEGETGFGETVKIPEMEEGNANVRLEVISATVKMIEPRTYIYKVQVMAYITLEQMEDLECARALDEDALVLERQIDTLEIVADRKEMFRINEQLEIAAGSPAIEKIVWKDVKLKSINTRVLDKQIELSGELSVFIMYISDVEGSPQQWIEKTVDFSGVIEIDEAQEGMVSFVDAKLHTINVAVTLNADNEMKCLDISALLKLNIKLYQELENTTIEDVYAPNRNLIPVFEEMTYNTLLVKNQARTKNTMKIDIAEPNGHILQLCHGSSDLKIENIIIGDNSIKILGKIIAEIIYISSDDKNPVCCKRQEMPFEHKIDAEDISSDDKYYIDWRNEQVTANMLSSDQVEIKTVIAMEAIVFRTKKESFITRIDEEELDMEEMNNIPLIKGYIVQPGDTLWQLAKKNHTTMEDIMNINELENDKIKKGDKLLLVKSCQ